MVAPGRADQATVRVKPPPVIFTAVGIVITGEKRTCDNGNLSESVVPRLESLEEQQVKTLLKKKKKKKKKNPFHHESISSKFMKFDEQNVFF